MICNVLGTCIVAMGLTHLDIGETTPLYQTASSYDNIERDISRFYTPESRPWSIAGTIITRDNTKLDLGYNSGLNTSKLDVNPSVNVGITQLFEMGNSTIAVGASTSFGGQTKHESCVDGFDREYYCANLTAWSEFEAPEHKQPYNVSLRYSYKF